MKRALVALVLSVGVSIPVVGGFADPAFAGCADADGEEKLPGLPYQGLGTLNNDGSDQTDGAPLGVGQTVRMKARYTNVDENSEPGDVKVVAVDNGTPHFRVRYYVNGKNITAAMKATGRSFNNIEFGERTKVLTVEVKAKAGSEESARTIYLDGDLRGNTNVCTPDRVGLNASVA